MKITSQKRPLYKNIRTKKLSFRRKTFVCFGVMVCVTETRLDRDRVTVDRCWKFLDHRRTQIYVAETRNYALIE